ncbi:MULTISPECIES: glycoside hydrolase family 16 protein [unclassified Rhizobium]|uniref:endo-1,3-1,4-beta-glycanase ExoK n=1 Tax=unclassified Rhizobium TaxID=2613769 RepID=UPI0006F60DFB|nr:MULTISPECIES: glycoside hydrolase family 16 protein [unclassified Rhizobium]KQV33340.1 1,3-1,4-beta-glycanase [Rhizobium sp. Root1212]KRD22474.1 1,3-1,4-beta-glycanase [Rhizobium sp. Root268]
MTTRYTLLALAIATGLSSPAFAQEGAAGTSFVEDFDRLDPAIWYVSDGWNNGAHQNCTWSKDQVGVADGMLTLTFEQKDKGERQYVCGEIQTKKRFGYGTYEVRMKTADGSGLNSAFFSYIGPADKKPHDEIDFEVLGKNPAKVQLNQYVGAKGGNEKLADVEGGANSDFHDYAFVWQKDRLRYYVDGKLVQEVTDAAKLPTNAQKIFVSLWGTDTLKDWMGAFSYSQPATLQVDRIAFTAEGDACQWAGSIACALN